MSSAWLGQIERILICRPNYVGLCGWENSPYSLNPPNVCVSSQLFHFSTWMNVSDLIQLSEVLSEWLYSYLCLYVFLSVHTSCVLCSWEKSLHWRSYSWFRDHSQKFFVTMVYGLEFHLCCIHFSLKKIMLLQVVLFVQREHYFNWKPFILDWQPFVVKMRYSFFFYYSPFQNDDLNNQSIYYYSV